MLRIAIVVVILTLLCPGQHAQAEPYRTNLSDTPNRVWIGAGFWANRLQDWRVEEHRVECVEDAPRFPLRTLSLLGPFVSQEQGSFEASVDLGFGGSADRPGAFAGLLLGVGGPTVDYRISAQVHHRPAAVAGSSSRSTTPDAFTSTTTNKAARAVDNGPSAAHSNPANWSKSNPVRFPSRNPSARCA